MNTPIRTGCKRSGKRSTPYGNRTSSPGCFAPFKSPLLSKSTESTSPCRKSTEKTMRQRLSTLMNKETLLDEIESLKKSIQEKDIQLEKLDKRDPEQIEAETRIDKLHTYNELKDIAQMVMGKLAEIEGTTSKEMYTRFDIDLAD